MTADGRRKIYILDTGNSRIRRIDAQSGIVTTVAGYGSRGEIRATVGGDTSRDIAFIATDPSATCIWEMARAFA